MDEATTRVVLQIPDDMMRFLDRLAARQGFKTRALTKAIRFCIREEIAREPVVAEAKPEWIDL